MLSRPIPRGLGDDIGDGHMLGLAFLTVGVGSAIGASYAGAFGGIAGAMAGGAITNGVRAYQYGTMGTPEGTQEAIVSGTYSVVGFAASLYLLYKTKNPGDRDDE